MKSIAQILVEMAVAEAIFYRRPYSIFNHPLFPKQKFTFNYDEEVRKLK